MNSGFGFGFGTCCSESQPGDFVTHEKWTGQLQRWTADYVSDLWAPDPAPEGALIGGTTPRVAPMRLHDGKLWLWVPPQNKQKNFLEYSLNGSLLNSYAVRRNPPSTPLLTSVQNFNWGDGQLYVAAIMGTSGGATVDGFYVFDTTDYSQPWSWTHGTTPAWDVLAEGESVLVAHRRASTDLFDAKVTVTRYSADGEVLMELDTYNDPIVVATAASARCLAKDQSGNLYVGQNHVPSAPDDRSIVKYGPAAPDEVPDELWVYAGFESGASKTGPADIALLDGTSGDVIACNFDAISGIGFIQRVDAQTGEQVWGRPIVATRVVCSGGRIYFAAPTQTLDGHTGNVFEADSSGTVTQAWTRLGIGAVDHDGASLYLGGTRYSTDA